MRWRQAFWLLLAAVLSGCASLQNPAALRNIPASAELSGTPFYPQLEHQCGPAALATVLQAAGYPAEPAQLAPRVYLPSREGSLQAEIVAAARRQGALALPAPTALPALLAEVAAGRPVLVLQNLGLTWAPRWHYAVLIGYDRDRQLAILRSGTTQREQMSLATFEHTWTRGGNWGLLVLPPGELPVTAEVELVENALAALENFAPPARLEAFYRTASERWPDSQMLRIGLANARIASGDLEAALRDLRAGSERHPDSAVVLNNLATVLQMLGKLDEALAVAEKAAAAAADGPWETQVNETLRDIVAAKQARTAPATRTATPSLAR